MKSLISTIALFFYCIQIGICCSCEGKQSFCYGVSENSIVVQCVVISKPNDDDIQVEILNQIIGSQNTGDTLLILGQDGLNCGEDMDLFELGDSLILNLINIEIEHAISNISYDWLLNGCNYNYLRLENNNVIGRIQSGVNQVNYNQFISEISDCIDYSVNTKETYPNNNEINIYPNPFQDFISIESSSNDIYEVVILSTDGQLVLKKQISESGNLIDLNTLNLTKGIYLIQINSKTESILRKIVKT